MNVTEDGLKEYIREFHSTLDAVSSRFFDLEKSGKLLHKSLLPAKITCYVSTQFGVAFEYTKAQETSIDTVRGGRRIEDLVVQAPSRLRNVGPMFKIDASNTGFVSLTISEAFPFRLNNPGADVTFQDVRFSSESLKWSRHIEYAEVYGNRAASNWSVASAQNRAKDEILAALVLAQQAQSKEVSLHEYISSFREKTVLVLGSYDEEGKKRLDIFRSELKSLGYEPLLVKDIPDFEHYDLSQKVTVVGALSPFIMVDDSAASGHLAEVEICKNNRWVTVLLRLKGRSASWMTAGASFTSNVVLEKEYNVNDMGAIIKASAEWAEGRLAERKTQLNKLYPWRTES